MPRRLPGAFSPGDMSQAELRDTMRRMGRAKGRGRRW